jgi:hypothetical protein
MGALSVKGDKSMSQIQCPNCGGYKSEETGKTSILDDPTPWTESEKKGCRNVYLKLVVIIAAISLIPAGWFFVFELVFDNRNDWLAKIVLSLISLVSIPATVLFLGGFCYLFVLWQTNTPRRAVKGVVYSYYCSLCGYKWNWQSGMPLPVVNFRPDLITKGEQRLREQAAADDAAYHAFVEPNLPKFGK